MPQRRGWWMAVLSVGVLMVAHEARAQIGGPGVAKAIEILGKELDVTMALCGVTSVRDIDRSVIARTEA